MAQLFDLKNNIKVAASIIPQASGGGVTGDGVDCLGFNSVTLVGSVDDVATGSFKLQESDVVGSGYTDVSDDEVITGDGSNDTAAVASDSVTIGYAGVKQFVRAVFTETVAGDVSSNIVLGNPNVAPTGANS